VDVLNFFLRDLFPQNSFWFFDPEVLNRSCLCASKHGQVSVLHFLFKKILPHSLWCPDAALIDECCILAADHKHVAVIEFFFKESEREEVLSFCRSSFQFLD
jgi:hypothetical protein